jgi:hypothetical protein
MEKRYLSIQISSRRNFHYWNKTDAIISNKNKQRKCAFRRLQKHVESAAGTWIDKGSGGRSISSNTQKREFAEPVDDDVMLTFQSRLFSRILAPG